MAELDDVRTVIIDDDILIRYVKRNFLPEDVFDVKDLKEWALENGFIEEEE